MESFSENDKNLMRSAQFNRCAMCRKELEDEEGEAHTIYRSHVYRLNGVLLCKDCHKTNYSYGRPPLKVGGSTQSIDTTRLDRNNRLIKLFQYNELDENAVFEEIAKP